MTPIFNFSCRSSIPENQPVDSLPYIKVGIIADSHGNAHSIRKALSLLHKENCDAIFHLGDICDSLKTDTLSECIGYLKENGVNAIKGNNDHIIIANNQGLEKPLISSELLHYLAELPLKTEYQGVVFAHSLPFAQELGLACMVQAMGKLAMNHFMSTYPDSILFRGHSHKPEISWKQHQRITVRPISAGEILSLEGKIPCVVTCGALTDGFGMVWEPEKMQLKCLGFDVR